MKRSLPLLAVALASLILPAATFAADPPVNRAWQITALVVDGVRTKVEGKLWIQGTNLGASAGCNSIGAQVSVDGNVLTIVGPTSMTEMACPGVDGQAESILLKILAGGKLTIEAGKWVGNVGEIEVTEVPVAPVDPGVPPDQPVTNEPGCVNVVVPDGAPAGGTDGGAPVPGDTGSGSGSGSSGETTGGGPAIGGATDGESGKVIVLPAPGGAGQPAPAPTPIEVPCANVGSGVAVDPGTTVGTGAPPELSAVDTTRDVLFIPLAIGFAILAVVTVGLLLRTKPAPAERPTE